jgi:hypothetical protein
MKIDDSKGLGDSVEKVIKFFQLDRLVKKNDRSSCSKCEKRKEKLNKSFPYRKPSN